MAVHDDLGAFWKTHPVADLLDRCAPHELADVKMPRSREMSLSYVTRVADRTRVLALAPDIEQNEARIIESRAQLLPRDLDSAHGEPPSSEEAQPRCRSRRRSPDAP